MISRFRLKREGRGGEGGGEGREEGREIRLVVPPSRASSD